MCVYVEARGGHQPSSLITLHLESRVYKMALSSSPVCSRDPIAACRVLGLQVAATPAWLFCRRWNLNSGPHACGQINALLAEPCPTPQLLVFNTPAGS